jgi:glycosyltransferase involved in cell wall biosynthesis
VNSERRRAHRLHALRQGPAEAAYTFLRARRRARNQPDDDPTLAPSEARALDPALDATRAELDANAAVVHAWRNADGPVDIGSVVWFVPWFHNPHGGGIATILRFARHFAAQGARQHLHVYDRDTPKGVDALVEFGVTAGANPPPAADAAIATSWSSAFAVLRHDAAKAKFFFVQDDEPAFHPAGSASALFAEAGRFGLPGIVNTPGLAETYPGESVAFTPAVDHDVYFPPSAARPDAPVRIVFYARPQVARNAFVLGLRTLRLVKERCGDRVEIVAAGEDFHPGAYGAADVLTNVGALSSPQAVAELYRSAHIGLVFMLTAHPSYQPFEYMACEVATVSNLNPRTAWFLRHEDNALVAPALPSLVAEQVQCLVDDPELRTSIARGGRATVSGLEWEPEMARVWDWMRRA